MAVCVWSDCGNGGVAGTPGVSHQGILPQGQDDSNPPKAGQASTEDHARLQDQGQPPSPSPLVRLLLLLLLLLFLFLLSSSSMTEGKGKIERKMDEQL